MRAALTLAAVLACLFAVFGSCTSSTDCCGSCPASQGAVFQLTCDETDLKTVTVTGPCRTPDGGSSFAMGNGIVVVDSQGAGVCHVELTFETGFAFATDVSFETRSGGVCGGPQCRCGDFVAPTSGPFSVHNPSATCVEAGIDADADAEADAEAGPNVCPSDASQDVPCGPAFGATCQGCREHAIFECTCGFADAGVPDPGALDAGVLDASVLDAGVLDAGVIDAGVIDASGGPSWQCVDRFYECGR
jgi:hypothetical protein